MIDTPCPICQNNNGHRLIEATDLFFGSLHDFTYARCQRCGHLRLLPEAHVGSGAFGRGKFEDKDERVVLGVLDHPVLTFGFYAPRSQWISARVGLMAQHTALDVGCGSGQFLRQIKRQTGCAVVGIDLDPAYETKAQKDGIRRVTGDFEQFDTEERFDLITMHHLIEHLNDPAASIRKAWELLKPGGYLYLETPAADSVSFKFFGRHWLPLLPPYHRHIFTRQSLESLLHDHFPTSAVVRATGVWVPLEAVVSTWLWWARICPHPFRRQRVPLALKLIGLAGMALTSALALPVEILIGASVNAVDAISQRRALFAAHQRVLCQKI